MQPRINQTKPATITSFNPFNNLATDILFEISTHLIAISTQHKSSTDWHIQRSKAHSLIACIVEGDKAT